MMDDPSEPHPDPEVQERPARPRGIVASFAFGSLILAVLLWQFAGVREDGAQLQVLDPGLELVWKVLLVVFVAATVACALLVWTRRSWTMPIATVNAVANGAVAGVTVLLTLTDELFAPTLPARVAATFETSSDWSGLTEPFLLVVLVIAVGDGVDGLVQAKKSHSDRDSDV